ncbi:MFS transporter [Bacillus infantis]|uniref:MFS transporter n=1 Tax=Bacillus infantis TaxID=324767 RepID=A0A5D4R3B4_9BACI|nr:MFS transporter [Bacillus infantis]TYS44168.1 MFS transporter [Bacillus infantis]
MKSKSFRSLWIGQSLANLGDVFYIVGLISILYSVTGSPVYLALLPFLNMAGRAVSGAVSPLLLNKFRLKSMLVFSQVSKTAVLSLLAGRLLVQSAPDILFVLVLIFVIAVFDGWALPASDAMLPRLVEKEELMKANSFLALLNESIQLGGWAFGGILTAAIGGQYVIWLTLAFYAVSSLMMQLINDRTPFQPSPEKQGTVKVLLEGWIFIWTQPALRSFHVVILIEAIANVVWIAAILYVFVAEVLKTGEAWWGYINTAFFMGLILGGVICTKFSSIFEKNMKLTLISSSFGVAIVTLLFGANSLAWAALLLVFLSGLIHQIKGIIMYTYIQRVVSAEELPKVFSAQHTLVSLAFALSTILFGAIAENISVVITFLIAGILLLFGGIYLLAVRKRFSQDFMTEK